MNIFLFTLRGYSVARNLWTVKRIVLLCCLAAGLFSMVTYGANASPCNGVDRSLSSNRKLALAPKIAKELYVASVDVLQSFRSHGWSIIYVDTHESDETFLFYPGDPMTARYVTLWGGAATIYEEGEIEKWVLKNVPKIPRKLARCFAWHVTHDRDM